MTAYRIAWKVGVDRLFLTWVVIIAQVVGKVLVEGVREDCRREEMLFATFPTITLLVYLPEEKLHPVFGTRISKPVPGTAREFVLEIQSGA